VWLARWGGAVNWRITVEQTPYRQVRVTGGLNTFDFRTPEGGESLETPGSMPAFRGRNFGGALAHPASRSSSGTDSPGGALRACVRCSTTLGATTFNVNEAARQSWRTRPQVWGSSCS